MSCISVKTQSQISAMREGGNILKNILNEIVKNVNEGITTEALDEIAGRLMKKYGVKASFLGYRGFPASICVSVNDEVVHGIPNKRILKNGDIVSLDCGVYYKNMHTDSAVTVPVGIVSRKISFFLKTVKRAIVKAIKKARAGAYIGDISNIIQKTVEREGFSPVRSCIGHGVGVQIHEPPEIPNFGRKKTGEILCEGATLAIEPIVNMGGYKTYVDNQNNWTVKTADKSLSAHFEHTVLVTENMPEILT